MGRKGKRQTNGDASTGPIGGVPAANGTTPAAVAAATSTWEKQRSERHAKKAARNARRTASVDESYKRLKAFKGLIAVMSVLGAASLVYVLTTTPASINTGNVVALLPGDAEPDGKLFDGGGWYVQCLNNSGRNYFHDQTAAMAKMLENSTTRVATYPCFHQTRSGRMLAKEFRFRKPASQLVPVSFTLRPDSQPVQAPPKLWLEHEDPTSALLQYVRAKTMFSLVDVSKAKHFQDCLEAPACVTLWVGDAAAKPALLGDVAPIAERHASKVAFTIVDSDTVGLSHKALASKLLVPQSHRVSVAQQFSDSGTLKKVGGNRGELPDGTPVTHLVAGGQRFEGVTLFHKLDKEAQMKFVRREARGGATTDRAGNPKRLPGQRSSVLLAGLGAVSVQRVEQLLDLWSESTDEEVPLPSTAPDWLSRWDVGEVPKLVPLPTSSSPSPPEAPKRRRGGGGGAGAGVRVATDDTSSRQAHRGGGDYVDPASGKDGGDASRHTTDASDEVAAGGGQGGTDAPSGVFVGNEFEEAADDDGDVADESSRNAVHGYDL